MIYDRKAGRIGKLTALWTLARLRAREGHASVARQVAEMALLRLRNGVRPPEYFAAGLYRRELDWSTKLEFLGNDVYYRVIREINPPALHVLSNHKIVSHGFLSSFGIPTPPFYGFINGGNGLTFDNRPLRSAADLEALLRRIAVPSVCFKLIAGLRGEGFMKVTMALEDDPPAVVLQPDGRRVSVASLWDDVLQSKQYMGYFCQGTVEQHPDAARFYPHSLNTLRTWMYRRPDGRWEMHGCAMRMGVGESPVDNLCQGGIGPRVDIETGRLHAAIYNHPDRTIYPTHPTTGVQLEGAYVPMWDRVVELCHRVCDTVPFFNLLAVDVALGVDGPLVTEIESTPDPHQPGFDKGMGPMIRMLVRERRAERKRVSG